MRTPGKSSQAPPSVKLTDVLHLGVTCGSCLFPLIILIALTALCWLLLPPILSFSLTFPSLSHSEIPRFLSFVSL